jgi:hypothetical protein
VDRTNQGLHCSVQSMSVVPSELWVGAVQRWISGRLWLLDTNVEPISVKVEPETSLSTLKEEAIRLGLARGEVW